VPLFLPLYIHCSEFACGYQPLTMCILIQYCISDTVSTTVYLPLYIYLLLYILHQIFATVNDVLLTDSEYKHKLNHLSYKTDCPLNNLMVESMALNVQEI
jgi:hypothetical protein